MPKRRRRSNGPRERGGHCPDLGGDVEDIGSRDRQTLKRRRRCALTAISDRALMPDRRSGKAEAKRFRGSERAEGPDGRGSNADVGRSESAGAEAAMSSHRNAKAPDDEAPDAESAMIKGRGTGWLPKLGRSFALACPAAGGRPGALTVLVF